MLGITTGPPAVNENWLYLSVGPGRFADAVVNGAAPNAGFRLYHSAVPRTSLVPDFVVALITPPPVVLYSAENADVCTVNSCTVSGEKLTMVRARLMPVLLVPSARMSVPGGRPPFTLILQPGHVVTDTITGFSLPTSPETFGSVTARSSTLRFTSGTSRISRSVTVLPVVPDSVFTAVVSDCTVMEVETAPGSSVTSSVAITAVSTFTCCTMAFLNPSASTVTL